MQFEEIEIYTKLLKSKIRWVNLRPLSLAIKLKTKLILTAVKLFYSCAVERHKYCLSVYANSFAQSRTHADESYFGLVISS